MAAFAWFCLFHHCTWDNGSSYCNMMLYKLICCLYMLQQLSLHATDCFMSRCNNLSLHVQTYCFFCKIVPSPSRLYYIVPEALMLFVAKTSSSWKKLSMKALYHIFGKTSRKDRTTVSSTPQIFLLVQLQFISRLFGLQIFIAFFSK